ncbi:MAG: RnfABCDGE type electron transport complex subunit D [Methyloprofundus sp.]|nr:RnfABCDGE type electron transport complex subunit D [Methyloprofundus sp.]
MQFPTSCSPFTPSNNSVQRIMFHVIAALLPAIAVQFWFFGFSILMQICLAIGTALLTEALCLTARKRDIVSALSDGSALLTALLIAIAIPSIAPWWVVITGTLFAILIAKHIYGGLGYNPFNPAMAAYVFLLISFPLQMTQWQSPFAFLDFSNAFQLIFSEQIAFDGTTSATVLDLTKTQLHLGQNLANIQQQALFGFIADKNRELINLAYLLGGLFLLHKKIIHWAIPTAVILGLLIPASIAYSIDNSLYSSPTFHLMAGATLCCAFFIATDPVTASSSKKGRLIYGLLIGSLIYCIRTWGGYPDAAAFAVLLANLSAPSIDYYLKGK